MIAHAAAVVILWFALALTLAPFIGERLKGRAPAPPDDWDVPELTSDSEDSQP